MIFLNRRILIPLTVYLLVLGSITFFGIRPLISEVHTSTNTLHQKQQEHASKASKLQQLKTLDSAKADIEEARSLSIAAIPETLDQDHLIPLLEKIVTENHATITNLDVQGGATAGGAATPAKKGTTTPKLSGLATIAGSVDFTGSYEVVQQTLSALENNRRLMTINSVTLTPNNANSGGDMSASVKLTAYGKGDKR